MDMTESIAPKSDQLNAEDLLTGPRTFTIAEVRRGSVEQPVDVHLVEFPGRPFKPSKTVRRIMVSAWGPDAATYAGKRLTLYRDPTVRFGGMDVGGIRVSHMSNLKKPLTIVLAVSKGKRAPHIVQPLPDEPPPSTRTGGITQAQLNRLGPLLREAGMTDRETGLAFLSQTIGRDVTSSKELTEHEADTAIKKIEDDNQPQPPADDVLPGTEGER